MTDHRGASTRHDEERLVDLAHLVMVNASTEEGRQAEVRRCVDEVMMWHQAEVLEPIGRVLEELWLLEDTERRDAFVADLPQSVLEEVAAGAEILRHPFPLFRALEVESFACGSCGDVKVGRPVRIGDPLGALGHSVTFCVECLTAVSA